MIKTVIKYVCGIAACTHMHRRWRIKQFYVKKCQTEINRFKVFDDQ